MNQKLKDIQASYARAMLREIDVALKMQDVRSAIGFLQAARTIIGKIPPDQPGQQVRGRPRKPRSKGNKPTASQTTEALKSSD